MCLVFNVCRPSVKTALFSLKSMLELLVLKNAAECTRQRLKRTSGARVMIIFGRSVARIYVYTNVYIYIYIFPKQGSALARPVGVLTCLL